MFGTGFVSRAFEECQGRSPRDRALGNLLGTPVMSSFRKQWIGMVAALCGFVGSLGANVWGQDRNPWISVVGEARLVQIRTENIANRISSRYRHHPISRSATHLDYAARDLLDAFQYGDPPHRIRMALDRTNGLWRQVRSMIDRDCDLRQDRTLISFADSLDRRLTNLERAVHRVLRQCETRRPPRPARPPFAQGEFHFSLP
jgi:hypothetical protein